MLTRDQRLDLLVHALFPDDKMILPRKAFNVWRRGQGRMTNLSPMEETHMRAMRRRRLACLYSRRTRDAKKTLKCRKKRRGGKKKRK